MCPKCCLQLVVRVSILLAASFFRWFFFFFFWCLILSPDCDQRRHLDRRAPKDWIFFSLLFLFFLLIIYFDFTVNMKRMDMNDGCHHYHRHKLAVRKSFHFLGQRKPERNFFKTHSTTTAAVAVAVAVTVTSTGITLKDRLFLSVVLDDDGGTSCNYCCCFCDRYRHHDHCCRGRLLCSVLTAIDVTTTIAVPPASTETKKDVYDNTTT